MSESNQNTPDTGEDNGGTENNTGNQTKNDNNKNNTTYNPHNKGGGKTRKQYNEHQSLQYEGKNPEIGGILALRPILVLDRYRFKYLFFYRSASFFVG